MVGYNVLLPVAGLCVGGVIGLVKFSPFNGKGHDLPGTIGGGIDQMCFFGSCISGFAIGTVVSWFV